MEFLINSFNGFVNIKISKKEIYLRMMQLYECSEEEDFVNALMICIHRRGADPKVAKVISLLKTIYDAYMDNLIEPPFNVEEEYKKVVVFLKEQRKRNQMMGKSC